MATKQLKVYLAGGWFSPFQDKALTELESILFSNPKFKVYSPRKEIKLEGKEGIEMQNFVFAENCKNINEADIVIASTVDKDMGTLWECGFAFANKKPIIYTLFDERFKEAKFNLMLAASGIAAFTDKQEFIKFLDKITPENVSSIKQRYGGEFE
jgi:nucleoside deoxyribosyltransferase